MKKNVIIGLFLLISFCGNSKESKRIISLAPSVTENIYLLDAQDKLVGCTSYCTMAVNDNVQQIGSAVDVNIEKILSLQPDLVLTMELTKPQDVAAIRKLGIDIIVIKTPVNFIEICEQTIQIAALVGKEKAAAHLIDKIKKQVTDIQNKSKNLASAKVLFQIGSNPIFTVLENTYMNDFITFCNATNIAAGLKHGTLTRESVIVKNPDVIIIAEMGGFGAEEKKVWETYKGLSAVKNRKVFLISSETSCSPTPENFISALRDVYNFINH